jgi:hypothetical protein
MRALRALAIMLVASSSFLLGCGGLPEGGTLTESAGITSPAFADGS